MNTTPRPWPRMVEALLPLNETQRTALTQSIETSGIQEPIKILPDGRIIDGHHRWQLSDGTAPVKVLDLDEETAFSLGIELNVARRQMTPEQVREIRERLQRAAHDKRVVEKKSQQQTADELGVARETVRNWEAQTVTSNGLEAKASNPTDVRVAVPSSKRAEIAQRISTGVSQGQVAADFGVSQQRVSQIVAQQKAAQRVPEPAITPDGPAGRFRCIVIDPPWPMQKIVREQRPNQGEALDYPTMPVRCQDVQAPIDEYIGERPCFHETDESTGVCQSIECVVGQVIRDSAEPTGCHVYLWVTQRFLPAGLDLFESWGVKYQCVMTWRKNVGITPFSWMYDTEHVLFGRVGSLDLERKGLRLSFEAKISKHSAKPDVFYERVLEASPVPRLELFSRTARDGFTGWGNEVSDAA